MDMKSEKCFSFWYWRTIISITRNGGKIISSTMSKMSKIAELTSVTILASDRQSHQAGEEEKLHSDPEGWRINIASKEYQKIWQADYLGIIYLQVIIIHWARHQHSLTLILFTAVTDCAGNVYLGSVIVNGYSQVLVGRPTHTCVLGGLKILIWTFPLAL